MGNTVNASPKEIHAKDHVAELKLPPLMNTVAIRLNAFDDGAWDVYLANELSNAVGALCGNLARWLKCDKGCCDLLSMNEGKSLNELMKTLDDMALLLRGCENPRDHQEQFEALRTQLSELFPKVEGIVNKYGNLDTRNGWQKFWDGCKAFFKIACGVLLVVGGAAISAISAIGATRGLPLPWAAKGINFGMAGVSIGIGMIGQTIAELTDRPAPVAMIKA